MRLETNDPTVKPGEEPDFGELLRWKAVPLLGCDTFLPTRLAGRQAVLLPADAHFYKRRAGQCPRSAEAEQQRSSRASSAMLAGIWAGIFAEMSARIGGFQPTIAIHWIGSDPRRAHQLQIG